MLLRLPRHLCRHMCRKRFTIFAMTMSPRTLPSVSPFNSLVHLMILCSASLATYMYSMYPRGTPQRHEAQAHHVGMRMIFYPGADERTRPLPVYPNGPPKSPGRPGDGAISSFHFPHRFHCWRPLKQRVSRGHRRNLGCFWLEMRAESATAWKS